MSSGIFRRNVLFLIFSSLFSSFFTFYHLLRTIVSLFPRMIRKITPSCAVNIQPLGKRSLSGHNESNDNVVLISVLYYLWYMCWLQNGSSLYYYHFDTFSVPHVLSFMHRATIIRVLMQLFQNSSKWKRIESPKKYSTGQYAVENMYI